MAPRSMQARSERPIRRWISWVRPLWRPRAASRAERVCVARGSIPYSAVSQPLPLLRRKAGTPFSTLAVHKTRVPPNSQSTEPSACAVKRRVKRTGRNSSAARPPGRMLGSVVRSAMPDEAGSRGIVAVRRRGGYCPLDQLFQRGARRAVAPGAGLQEPGDLGVLEVRPDAVGADHEDVAVLERLAARDRHLGQLRLAAQAALDEVPHRVARDLLFADRAFAQELLDVAVVARARDDRAAAQVVDAAVADVRPP